MIGECTYLIPSQYILGCSIVQETSSLCFTEQNNKMMIKHTFKKQQQQQRIVQEKNIIRHHPY